jgi:hypothetical protein
VLNPKHRELLARFLGAAIPLDPIWRCHAHSRASKGLHKTQAAPLPGLRRSVAQVIGWAMLTFFPSTHVCGHAAGAMAGRRRFLAIERESVLFGQ